MAIVQQQKEVMPGWGEANSETRKRLIVSVEAIAKRGKSHFSLTAPGPLAYFDLNVGGEGVVGKFTKEKKVYAAKVPYRYYDKDGKDIWTATWDRYKGDYLRALATPAIRSLVVDTNTEAWELIRLARFGRRDHVPPVMYGPVNAEFGGLIERGIDSGKNILFIHTMGDEYVGKIVGDKDISVRTGRLKTNAYKDMSYLVQVSIQLLRDDSKGKDEDGNLVDVGDRFGLRITDCRLNPSVNGTELWGPFCNFAYLAMTVFPDSELEDWQ